MRNALVFVGLGAVILAGGWWYLSHLNDEVVRDIDTAEPTKTQTDATTDAQPKETHGAAIGDENLATFKCDGGKSITAVFERDIVGLTLSDGRQMTLRQAVSGSLAGQAGIRYLSNDSKIEFRGKGTDGYLVEDGATTYANCSASQ